MNNYKKTRETEMINPGPVGLEKERFKANDMVCCCFGHTRKQIKEDFVDNGRSVILEKLASEKNQETVIALGKIQKIADV
ncbi:MAG: hypothetical protein ACOCPS_04660 [Desulfonatronovibrio sp.]